MAGINTSTLNFNFASFKQGLEDLKNSQLWGTIARHDRTPKLGSVILYQIYEFLRQSMFTEISIGEDLANDNYRSKLAHLQAVAIDRMSQAESFIDGLMGAEPNLLDLLEASGAAICFGGHWTKIGKTPADIELNCLVEWLTENMKNDVLATDLLPSIYTDARQFTDVASGLLAISLSKHSYVLCFRPEVIQTVHEDKDPHTTDRGAQPNGNVCLDLRKSCELSTATRQLHSRPWQGIEVKAASELRQAIVTIVLRQATELAILATNLEPQHNGISRVKMQTLVPLC
jgi:two-component system, chemotaxis family, sensor kinase Cph1